MEEQTADKTVDVKPKYSRRKLIRNAAIFFIATSVGYFHYWYVWTIHENTFHYSHLSNLEKELAFHSEQGFYYSYYKTMIEKQPFIDGIFKLMYDRLVEYPEYVNAFNRFNIHPEVIIAALYRYLEPSLNSSASQQCFMVSRGAQSPVLACAGWGHPSVFYLHALWVFNALVPATVFLHATTLSESILGGVLSVSEYMANHAEATRVWWSPNERENAAGPLLLLQGWLLALQLRHTDHTTCFRLQVSIFILNCLCLLFWQFSQFVFLTQILIFFVMEQLKIIDLKMLCVFLHSHFCGLHMAALLLQGNDMLKSSLYASTFIVVSTYSLFFSTLRIKIKNRTDFYIESWLVLLRIAIVISCSIYLKRLISDFLNINDDGHIWNLLYSKFTSYKSFHTLIYTCTDTFDFISWEIVSKLINTLLIPFALYSSLMVSIYWVKNALKDMKNAKTDEEKSKSETDQPNAATEKADRKTGAEISDDTDDSGIENNADSNLVKRTSRLDLDKLDEDAKSKEVVSEDSFILFVKSLQIDPAIFYNVSQMVVFGILAYLFMRLKYLWISQMCIVCPLVVNTKYEIKTLSWTSRLVFWTVSVSVLLYRLYANMSSQLSVLGEFNEFDKEELMEWIRRETSASAVFAGSMPVLATVMLTTRRAVVAHPHYENAGARERAYAVYKTYGRFTPDELYRELSKLQATYLIVEASHCYGGTEGCTFLDIWDAAEPSRSRGTSLCHTLLTRGADHLYRVFQNDEYSVFRVHDLSVRYMPRVFDT